jgi:ArsR family metal-binding transcriptional regulator
MEIREISPCQADPEKIKVIGKIDVPNLEKIMPYLARIIPNATYSEKDGWIVFKKGLRIITIYKDSFVAMTYITDENEALEILKSIKEKAREAWEKRDQIDLSKPLKDTSVTVLDIYKLLPKTNCKECGELTCMAFAVKILNSEKNIRECKPLFREERYQKFATELLDLLTRAGYI